MNFAKTKSVVASGTQTHIPWCLAERCSHTGCTVRIRLWFQFLESSLLQDIPTLNGQDSSQLEDWRTDIETASELTGESRTKIAQAKSKGISKNLNIRSFNSTKDLGGN